MSDACLCGWDCALHHLWPLIPIHQREAVSKAAWDAWRLTPDGQTWRWYYGSVSAGWRAFFERYVLAAGLDVPSQDVARDLARTLNRLDGEPK